MMKTFPLSHLSSRPLSVSILGMSIEIQLVEPGQKDAAFFFPQNPRDRNIFLLRSYEEGFELTCILGECYMKKS